MLSVTIYNAEGEVVAYFDAAEGNGVDYVSLVSSNTYGPPPLIAPPTKRSEDAPRAAVGEVVLYINTAHIPAFSIRRESD